MADDRILVHQLREAIRTPLNGLRPTVPQALVAVIRLRDGNDVTVEHIIRCVVDMNDYERCRAVALIWRREKPELSGLWNENNTWGRKL